MTNKYLILILALAGFPGLYSCNKDGNTAPPVNNKLSYGDSVFYVRDQATDYIIMPNETRPGAWSGFPEGIEINDKTGAVTINKSETGLRYKISFVPDGSKDTISTIILISGINYFDKIYNLSNNDTLAMPVYNANAQNPVPGTMETAYLMKAAVVMAKVLQ